ncbi:uncharacterized protein LOC120709503 [Panicum virgatum]|uniref:uncharacterized protein LOC120709503 n=1 Tax=Panicum virgatum TaxID=38727 RepID=UPI0019D4FFCA|nr:uncharacterized protein LOC120709503 [Panicum virgatum]
MLVAPGAALTAGRITPVQTVEATLQAASHEAALDGDMACWSTDLRPRPSLPHHPAWIPRAQNIVWSARPDGVKSWWQATERPSPILVCSPLGMTCEDQNTSLTWPSVLPTGWSMEWEPSSTSNELAK